MRLPRFASAPLALAIAASVGAGAVLLTPGTARADSLEVLQQRIEESNTAYEEAVAHVDELQQEMDANEERIAQIEAELPEKRAAAAESMRTIYKMQVTSGGLLELLLSSEDFNEVIANVRYLDTITSKNNDAINELVSLDDELNQTKSALASEKAQADSDAAAAQDALSDAVSAREALEAQIAAQAAAEAAAAQAAVEAAQKAAAAQAAAAETTEAADAATEDAADAATTEDGTATTTDSSNSTFTTESGNTSTVKVPENTSASEVTWSEKDQFVSTWSTRIDAYLAGSPLSGYGKTFAEAAWAYGVDPRFSPAISCVESSKGAVCFKPHNAWGWGSSSWSTWEEAIWAHVAGLASGYGGHLTYSAAQKYCPPTADLWYATVLSEMESI